MKVSLYGNGFVGSEYYRQYKYSTIVQDRDEFIPQTNKILYGISTVTNYNVLDDPFRDIETNLMLMMDVLDRSRRKFSNEFEFNFISSWFVYGQVMLPASEISGCNPKGFYSITKKAAEDLLISYCRTFNIPYRIMRLTNVLGAGDEKVSAQKNATQWVMQKLIDNETVELYYKGDFFRDYIDVRDCARAINLVIQSAPLGSITNISNGVPVKFKDVVDYTINYCGSASEITDHSNTEFHEQVQVKSMYLHNGKLEKLGYRPEYGIEDTLRWIIDAYKSKS